MVLATYEISPELPAISATPLTPEAFKPFGYVISPDHLQNDAHSASANQGTAVKFIEISKSESQYNKSSSGKRPDFTRWNLFRCSPPNHLITESHSSASSVYLSKVLEQHPYSTQTFLPLGQNTDEYAYMVIVAKTGPQGLPDLNTVQAFLAKGNQAVTYGVATWHAPMVVLNHQVDFAVLINENGEAEEDCREVYMDPGMKISYNAGSKKEILVKL